MSHHVESDISVQRFGYSSDDSGSRLEFPRAVAHNVGGRVGTVSYGGKDVLFDGLEGRLDTLRWTSEAMSIGSASLRDDAGRYDIAVERIEMSRGIMLTRADRGVEIVSPHVSLSEVKMTIKGPFGSPPKVEPLASEAPSLRQDSLRFLDSLTGRIYLTVKVVLDLPVIGKRTLDQQLRVPVQEGSLDYRALDKSLDWLEGAFLDIKHHDDRLAITWKVPIVGSSRDLISWKLDSEAATLASFGRVPVRSLADFRTKPSKANPNDRSGILQALSLDAIDIALSLVAPRSVDAAGGLIMFGGDDSPGMVDLKVSGAINDKRP
ncbi:MAG TPA: hypothetical protein VK427_02550, partial [Kofleriaceae bacterium]|nr:hypothetical protein [Kofleriaceae bacterium]